MKYFLGLLKYFFRSRVSKLSLITNDSVISPKATVYRFAKIYKSVIGDYSYVCPDSDIVCTDIGKFCSIADQVKIGLPKHTISHISTSPIFTEQSNATRISWIEGNINAASIKRCKIGNDVWIGTRALILDGITIGDGAVIGAGTIVTHNVPPYAVVVGIPGKIIRYRFDPQTVNALLKLEWWNWSETRLKQMLPFFQAKSVTPVLLQGIDKPLSVNDRDAFL